MKHVYAGTVVSFWRRLIPICFFFAYALAAHAQVKGIVFRDFDMNGIRSDTLPIETGVAGVIVRAFVDISKTPITVTTAADGTYAFPSGQIPAGKTVRIEFDNMPIGDYNGPSGKGSGTSVQFVKAPAEGVDMGLDYPADYCQRTNVMLIMPCYVNGNSQMSTDKDGNPVPLGKQAAESGALVSFPYGASGVASDSNFPPNHLANAGQVGSLWGMAYQRRTKKVISSAVVKRHMSFGPAGPGGLYMTDMLSGVTTTFMSVSALGVDVGNDPHQNPLANLFGDKTLASTDPGSMSAMGRMSFGGIDMSEDDKTLYFVNLKDRKLYSLFIDSPARVLTAADVNSWAIPNPGCSNGDYRPWAVKMHHGQLYVGVICSAETSQQQSDLKATIYRFDPTAAKPVFTEVLSFPLTFRRGPADLTGNCMQYDHWLPWTDAWPTPCGIGNSPYFVMYPQPILTDLDFDDDGSLLIGFLDRFGHLAGIANHDPSGTGLYDGFTGGDLLRAYNNNGTFELEKNGKAGNLTGSGVGNNEGPVDATNVGGEFYGTDNWYFFGHVAHAEVSNGALSKVPGYNEVMTSAFDPITDVYQSGGLKIFNAQTGVDQRNYVLYTVAPGSFGKASGLGDVKALCDPAPVEIGNRVWFDDNRDGIQDAYEPGVDGIVLTLHDMEDGGKQIAAQTSQDGGQFYFNANTVPAGLLFNHNYEIRMDTTQLPLLNVTLNGTKPIALAGGRRISPNARQLTTVGTRHYSLSPANRADFTEPKLRDSNAKMVGKSAVITVTTLDAGQNDFTYDLSIYSCPELRNEKDTVRLCAGMALDSIATDGRYLSRVDSVRFVLFSSPQASTAVYGNAGVILGTVKPDSANRAVLYRPQIAFDNNTPGNTYRYVYAIVYPMPEDPACRQFDETVLSILPDLSVTAVGGQLTCKTKTVTLVSQALYSDGTAATSAAYTWSGPTNFTSTEQNPMVSVAGSYTVKAADPACPTISRLATSAVMSNTVVPQMTASVVAKTCVTCKATVQAESLDDATFVWSGPNNFTTTGASGQVTDDGTYTVTATGSNGCFALARLVVTPYICPPPACIPIQLSRVKVIR